MPNRIKPCKCGGNAHVTIGYIIGIPITYRVVCDKCFKSTQAVDTESQAIDEWNRSVDDAE